MMILDLTERIQTEAVPTRTREEVVPIWGEAAPSGIGIVETFRDPATLMAHLGSEQGTRIHFPRRYDVTGKDVEDYPVDHFITEAVVFHEAGHPDLNKVTAEAILLSDTHYHCDPEILRANRVRMIGFSGSAPNPQPLLGSDILVLENLVNLPHLDEIAGGNTFELVAVPLLYCQGSTAHVRAYARLG